MCSVNFTHLKLPLPIHTTHVCVCIRVYSIHLHVYTTLTHSTCVVLSFAHYFIVYLNRHWEYSYQPEEPHNDVLTTSSSILVCAWIFLKELDTIEITTGELGTKEIIKYSINV